ncbi:MAG: enoyl-ACP reductase FabI [Enterobacteriaceae bacterium]
MNLLKDKKILISGISNKYSIAYGIAKSLYREKASLAFSYQNERFKKKVKKIAKKFHSDIIVKCDVSKDKDIFFLFYKIKKYWKKFDGFVHSIAYAPKQQLNGDYVKLINRRDFLITHNISSYSFVSMAKNSLDMLNEGSSLVTITYVGSKRVINNYNIMGVAKASLEANVIYMANSLSRYGIRVNAISSAPISTLSSLGVKDFKKTLNNFNKYSLINGNVSIHNIGNIAVFLLSYLSNIITGQVIYADGGFNINLSKNI